MKRILLAAVLLLSGCSVSGSQKVEVDEQVKALAVAVLKLSADIKKLGSSQAETLARVEKLEPKKVK